MSFCKTFDALTTTAVYNDYYKDKSNGLCVWAETLADICHTPTRWVASAFSLGGRKVEVVVNLSNELRTDNVVDEPLIKPEELKESKVCWLARVVRTIIGVVLCIPCEIAAIKLKAFALCGSDEIWLKHLVAVKAATPEQKKTLAQLIDARQKLLSENQECEVVILGSCSFAASIVCLLTCIVCKM